MKTWTTLAVAALLWFAPLAGAASQQGLLPQSFGGFTANGKQSQLSPGELDKIAGSDAPLIREYGITSVEQADYRRGSQDADVALYQMVDPSAAFGVFTFLRTPEMKPFAVGPVVAYAAKTKAQAILVIGNLLLEIRSSIPPNNALIALAGDLRSHADRAPYPIIANFLPREGMVPGSERYVLGPVALTKAFPSVSANGGNWIGFDKNAEAIIAQYQIKGQDQIKGQAENAHSFVLVALYPTQQIAAEKYDQLNQWVALNGKGEAGDGRPVLFGKQTGSLVALVAGVQSQEAANAFLDQIQYMPQVTWNEPTHELTDPSISQMVIGAFMGTGVIMLLAFAAGIGFGGVRLFVKFMFPGKVFDRDQQVEILQLGLSGKRIEAKDFYLIDPSKPR